MWSKKTGDKVENLAFCVSFIGCRGEAADAPPCRLPGWLLERNGRTVMP
jgi:hypothetical protein